MAYYTTIDSFKNRVIELNNIEEIKNPNLSNLKLNGRSLHDMRDEAETNLKNLLKILGYSGADYQDDLKKLNEKIQIFQKTTSSFNGQLLRDKLINPLKGIVINDMQSDINNFKQMGMTKSKEIGEVFITLVQKITDEMLKETGQIASDDIAVELYSQLNQMTFDIGNGTILLGAGAKGGGGKLLSTKLKETLIKKLDTGIKTIDFSGGIDPNINQLIHKDPNFTRRLLLLAQSYQIPVINIFESSIQPPVFEITETSDGLQIYYDILAPFLDVMPSTDGKKAEKAAKLYFEGLKGTPKYEAEIEKLISRATTFLDQFFDTRSLNGNQAAYLQEKFNDAIRNIIIEYPAALFTGQNTQGVIGILGEIQGLYYMYSILGENPQIDPSSIVQWIGGNSDEGGGIKTGADLIIKLAEDKGYGIQIKNSMELTSATSFSDFSINRGVGSEFFNQLKSCGISTEIIAALEDIFTMKNFNIPYHLQGTMAVAGNPKGPKTAEYYDTYGVLEELFKLAQRYMALAAALIMRIQTASTDFKQSNTLWLIGGTAAISAVEILDTLIKQADGQLSRNLFNTSATVQINGGKTLNIVEYLNNGHNTKDLKTTLKTSYNFHKI